MNDQTARTNLVGGCTAAHICTLVQRTSYIEWSLFISFRPYAQQQHTCTRLVQRKCCIYGDTIRDCALKERRCHSLQFSILFFLHFTIVENSTQSFLVFASFLYSQAFRFPFARLVYDASLGASLFSLINFLSCLYFYCFVFVFGFIIIVLFSMHLNACVNGV